MKRLEIGKHLAVGPQIRDGHVVFKGTRLPVERVLLDMAKGMSLEEVIAKRPTLSKEAVAEALRLATQTLIERSLSKARVRGRGPRPGTEERRVSMTEDGPEIVLKYVEIGQHLVVDPRVCHGQLTFKGTRVPVETVLYYMAKGETMSEVEYDWPRVARKAVAEALKLAASALNEQRLTRARVKAG